MCCCLLPRYLLLFTRVVAWRYQLLYFQRYKTNLLVKVKSKVVLLLKITPWRRGGCRGIAPRTINLALLVETPTQQPLANRGGHVPEKHHGWQHCPQQMWISWCGSHRLFPREHKLKATDTKISRLAKFGYKLKTAAGMGWLCFDLFRLNSFRCFSNEKSIRTYRPPHSFILWTSC
jgi:hypothetical protein